MKKAIATFLTDTHLKNENLQLNHQIYKQSIQHTKNLGLDRIFHLGDIFDGRVAQTVTLLKDGFYDILELFRNENLQLIAIKGNHDSAGDSEIHSFLTPYQDHPNFNLTETYNRIELTKDIDLYLLSFFDDIQYNRYLKQMFDKYQITNSFKKKVLGSHIGISNAIMNNGTIVHSRVEDSFMDLFSLVLIGHFHDSQIFKNIHYIGSSIQHNFGEKPNKGLTVLYDDLSTELIPLDFPKYTTYHIKVTDLKKSDLKDLEEEKKEGNVRVFLEGTEEEVKSYNKQELLNLGIKVEKRVPKIEKKIIEQQVEKYDKEKLGNYFEEFCEQNTLKRSEGVLYLNQI